MGVSQTKPSKYRVAIVGLDHYHTTGWAESLDLFRDRLDVVALYDADAAVFEAGVPRFYDPNLAAAFPARYRELPYYNELGTLLGEQAVDLALVTLPNAQAPGAICELARSGVHVLVDKPGAVGARAAQEAVQCCAENEIQMAAGLLRRYGRGWQHAKSMIDSGRSGTLLSTEAVFNTSSPFVRDPENHIFSRGLQGGGILIWLGVHDVDQLLWLTGERIVEVQAMLARVNDTAIDVEDAISVSLRYESGAIGTIHYAYVLPRTLSDGYLAVRGSEGSVAVSSTGTLTWIGAGTAADPVREETLQYTNYTVPGYGSMAPAVIQDLLDAIEEKRPPRANGTHLVDALRVIDAAYESAQSGTRVHVDWG